MHRGCTGWKEERPLHILGVACTNQDLRESMTHSGIALSSLSSSN